MLSGKRRILIVSASIGSGHDQAAKAIADELKNSWHQAQVNIVDFMSGENSFLHAFMKETYLKMLTISPSAYSLLYRLTHSPQGSPIKDLLALVMYKRMKKLIEDYQPDLLICTHPFPCGAAAYFKEKYRTDLPLAAVITDFAVHRLWIYPQVNLYFTAETEMGGELEKAEVPRQNIHITGIPISTYFNAPYKDCGILKELGLSEGMPTVLLMGGGLGLGGFQEILMDLNAVSLPFQAVIVSGQNENLREELKEAAQYFRYPIKILGFTERVPDLMACATLLITKPGALTICEAMAMQLPMIFYEFLPGQEKENAAYITGKGAAVSWDKSVKLSQLLSNILTQPNKLQDMKVKAGALAKPLAAVEIAQIVAAYIDGRYNAISGL